MRTQRVKSAASLSLENLEKFEFFYYLDKKGYVIKDKPVRFTNKYVFFENHNRKFKSNVFLTKEGAELKFLNNMKSMFSQYHIDLLYGVNLMHKFIEDYPEEFI